MSIEIFIPITVIVNMCKNNDIIYQHLPFMYNSEIGDAMVIGKFKLIN